MVEIKSPPRIPPSRDSLARLVDDYPRGLTANDRADVAMLALERIKAILDAAQAVDCPSTDILVDVACDVATRTLSDIREMVIVSGEAVQA